VFLLEDVHSSVDDLRQGLIQRYFFGARYGVQNLHAAFPQGR
jgi:hypothetical protein